MAKLIVPNFSSGEVSPSIYGRVDTNEYQKALKKAYNAYVLPHGGITNRPGTIYCGPCKDHANPPRLIKFEFKTTDSYIIEMGDQYMRFLRNGYHLVNTPATITGITAASPGVVTTSAAHGYTDGDEVILTGMSGMTELNGRRVIIDNSTSTTFEIFDQFDGTTAIDTSGYAAYVSGGQCADIYELATPYLIADVDEVKFVQSADVITLTHPDYDPRNLSRTGHTTWSLDVISFVPNIAAPTGTSVTPVGASGSTTYTYRISAIEDETFIEGPYTEDNTTTGNATLDTTNYNTIAWSAVTGAFRYNIYKEEGGIYGYLATTEALSFNDQGQFSPNFDETPREPFDPFTGADNDPAAVGFHQQRKVYGSSTNEPDTMWFSVVADYNNFSRAFPSAADDGFQVVIDQRQVNEIRHFLSLDQLLVFTSGAEWAVSGGLDRGFSLTTFSQKPQSEWGCSHLVPLKVGRTVLFVQDLASTVRSIGYTFEADGFAGSNLTVLARHMFLDKQIRDWAFTQIPNSLVQACRDDGILLNLTFNQEQNVIAWTTAETKDGMFHSIEAIANRDAAEDVTYCVVKRLINGNDVAYIERFHTRKYADIRDNFFVDSGLTLDGPHEITNVVVDSAGKTTVTCNSHPFLDDDEIDISDIFWTPDVDKWGYGTQRYPALNNGRFVVGEKTANDFVLYDIDDPTSTFDGSDLPAYKGGGYARCAVDKIFGLHHLPGETVQMLGDGKWTQDLTVADDGTIDLTDNKVSRAHVGLGYITDIQLLELESPRGTLQGRTKRTPSVTLRLEDTVGAVVGPDTDYLTEIKWREHEVLFDSNEPLTGDKYIAFTGPWSKNWNVLIRQHGPLPLTLSAVIPDIEVSPTQI
jgi:hypothetical protein